MSAVTKRLRWAAYYCGVSYLALSVNSASEVYAQSAPLPPVTVDAPNRETVRPTQIRRSTQRTQGAPRRAAAAPMQPTAPVPYVTPSTGVLGAPPAPYAGGQVATGARVGFLGNKSFMDTPFNQTSYTAQLIQNQQARTIGDVMANDPSVRMVATGGGGLNTFLIRGFYYDSGDLSLNGLYGLSPQYQTAPNFVERVEVLKGPSALLTGMPPAGGIGGSINLVTKQAPDTPITQLTTTYQSRSQFGSQIDYARRYGEHKEFGIRFNGGYTSGDTDYVGQTDKLGNAVVNMDYRGERARFSFDAGYQDDRLQVPRRFLTINNANDASGRPGIPTYVPPVPDAGSMYGVPWSYWRPTDKFAMAQGEVDLTERLTIYGAIGWHDSNIDFRYASPTVTNIGKVGNWQAAPFMGADTFQTISGVAGARAIVDTGPITHTLNFNYSETNREGSQIAYSRYPAGIVSSNLYNSVTSNMNLPNFGGPEILGRLAKTHQSSIGFADTMSIWDDRIQFTAGARQQTIGQDSADTLNWRNNSTFEDTVWSPGYALVIKLLQNVSIYGNYIEGLQAGQTVGITFANAGTVFAPFHTVQKEVGVKIDWGRLTTTVAAFELNRPVAITLPNNSISPNGEQVNRGIEINTFGELAPGLRVLGGVAFIDAVLTKTAGGLTDGKAGQGVGDINFNMGAEWDTPFMRGLTLNGRVIYTSSAYLNASNSQEIPDWTRVDVGARYEFASPWNGKPIVARFNIENLLDKSYYVGSFTAPGIVTIGAPRTYLASMTFNF